LSGIMMERDEVAPISRGDSILGDYERA